MRQLVKHIRQLSTVAGLLISVAGFIGFFMPALAISDSSVADEIISLHVRDRPLGEVLENLSTAANCQFTIAESWKDYPVTASIDSETLYRGLKLILRDINNAVIYGADRTIKIMVYDKDAPSGIATRQSVANKFPKDFVQQSPISNDATAPQPEVEISEGSNVTEDDEQQLEEAAEPAADIHGADAENTSSGEDETVGDGSSGEIAVASEAEGEESSPKGEKHPAAETESTSGDFESAESFEGNQEADPN